MTPMVGPVYIDKLGQWFCILNLNLFLERFTNVKFYYLCHVLCTTLLCMPSLIYKIEIKNACYKTILLLNQ